MLSTGSPSRTWERPLSILVCLVLFLVGIWSVPLAIFGPDRALVPGDLGDARFNNYILEHFHRFITGRTGAFWDVPFMYPWKNVIALSDNLLGSAPIYSVYRLAGLSREGAFQMWWLTLFALNYGCCLLALGKWSGNWVLSACAAYIFAFGIYNIGQISNVQVFPKFAAPLAFLCMWRHLGTGSWKWLLLTMLAVVYQFYCGIYLGFIVLYALLFLVIGHLVAYREPGFLHRIRNLRYVGAWSATLLIGLLLLAPMMIHYLQVPASLGARDFTGIMDTIPRPTSYFFTHPAAISWHSLSGLGVDAFPLWWSHFHFIGAVPWLAVLAAPFLLFAKRTPLEGRRKLLGIGVALVLSTLFCLNMGGHSLYALWFQLPGFSVMRSIDRFINVQVLFFLFLFVAVVDPLFKRPRVAFALSLLLPAAVVQDNRWDVHELKRFDKFEAQDLVKEVERRITREYAGDKRFDAIAYEPPLPVRSDFNDRHGHTIATQITAMLAAQELGIATVNAYSGGYPGTYISFFDNMDHRVLADWCAFNGIGTERIQEIHGLAAQVVAQDTVRLKASNGRYVSTDLSKGGLALADRDTASDWETFLQITIADGRVAFLCTNGDLLCAEVEDHDQLSATASDLGDFGLFRLEPMDSGTVAIRAFNGRYVVLDPGTGQLSATGERADAHAAFRRILLR